MTFVEVTVRSLPHLLLGAAVFYAVIGRVDDTPQRKAALFLLGALLGLSPDFTKAFGDIALHSLLSVPVVAPLYALLLRLLVRNVRLPKLTAAAAAAIVFGHLLVDAAGNGNALLYPLTDYEFSLWLLNRHEAELSLVFGAGLLAAALSKKGRTIAAGMVGVMLLWIAREAGMQEMKLISLMINEVKRIL